MTQGTALLSGEDWSLSWVPRLDVAFTSQPLWGRWHVCLLMALCFWFLLLSTLEVRWGSRLLLGGSGMQNETNVSGYCNFMVRNIHAGMKWENSVWPVPTEAKGGSRTTPVLRGNLFSLLTTNHHLKQSLKGPPCPNAVMMMRGECEWGVKRIVHV